MESNALTIGVTCALGVLIALIYVNSSRAKRSETVHETTKPLRKLPLIGDLHSSPIEKPLVNWNAWTKENGPIAVPKLFGIIPIVVLNSAAAVTELFSRRSQWYSNRPASVSMEMITDAQPGQSKFTLMHDYDDHLKLHHRLLSPSLGAPAAPKFQALMELEATQLLFDLCQITQQSKEGIISTGKIYPQLERTQSSIILGLHYGLRVAQYEDQILHEVIDTQTQITHLAANPLLPDIIPALRHLPSLLSPWKRSAEKLYAQQVDLYMRLFKHGRDEPGWNATKQAISTAQKHAKNGVSDLDLAFTLATSIQGGMETSPRQLLWLFIAALHRPSFLTKAHAILDEVVGRDRLPRFSDRADLSFIDAIAHELFRWRPIAPGSIPRRADKDDEYEGVKIKKGWTLLANAWAIGRDEKVFDPSLGDVQEFVPERWLRPSSGGDVKVRADLPLPVFGQGRRVCQGKRVATDGTFLQVTCLLWAFDIQPLAEGDVVDPWEMVVEGFMTSPKDVRFKLTPRGDWVVDTITREWEKAGKSPEQVMGISSDVEK